MPERIIRVAAAAGLHARPAAQFTRAAGASGFAITVAKDGRTANAASILEVLSIGVNQGDEIVLRSDDPASESTLDELAAIVTHAE